MQRDFGLFTMVILILALMHQSQKLKLMMMPLLIVPKSQKVSEFYLKLKQYKVVGALPILDHQPGETFEAELSADYEAYLTGIGGIAEVADKPESKATKSADSR
jgi:hypothetical protein